MTESQPRQSTDGLDGHRDRLFSIAYRMTGSVADAEDVVQDVAETWLRTEHATIDDPEAWLVTVTTRRCLDRLRAASRARERYVGPWLPAPLVADRSSPAMVDVPHHAGAAGAGEPDPEVGPDPGDLAVLADEISYALMVILDELAPAERVAFVLHDVFGEPYERIAPIVERTPAAARQLASRARRRVHAAAPIERPTAHDAWQLAAAFFAASRRGELDGLVQLLAPDVTLVSDGGGIVSAALRPVVGADRVARAALGLAAKAADARVEPAEVDGFPGALLWWRGELTGVAVLVSDHERITGIYLIRNPVKLAHLGADS